MTTKTVYIANDGTEFEHEESCKEYERTKEIPKELAIAISTLATFCKKSKCNSCILNRDCTCLLMDEYPDKWGSR